MFARFGNSTESMASPGADAPIGILAGWGEYPLAVARALRNQGRSVAGVGIVDHADQALADLCDHFGWIGIGGIGRAARYFRRWGVKRAVMAGKVHKVLLYQPGWWFKHRPDWHAIRFFYPQLLYGSGDRKDDTMLGRVVAAFADQGVVFGPATDYVPELLASAGQIAGRRLTARQRRDVQFGWQMAKGMGALDVGQCVCVKDQTVLALEAIEGTDQCIQRAGQLCGLGGFSVVKVAKPNQDMRFDVPAVGVQTLESVSVAGGKVLAIEAGRTILLNQAEFCRAAARLRISVVAVQESELGRAAA
ncbi:MAG: UDP-2,3-diacylglucosamine diphosphatase LpxI [Pirellulales bacterium]|nr:UDP-2,3-diacylglucosamine diphosphatase LpxI [Pirellulales bacterium]